jgi:hypothetical protein
MASTFRIGHLITMLYQGQIVAFGSPAELRASPEPYRRKPKLLTISRSCSDHAGLHRRRVPVRPSRALAGPRSVAAAWQRERV